MKKFIMKSATLCLMLMAGNSAQAQIDLGNILGNVLGSSTSSSSSSSSSSTDLISTLTSVFSSSKQASKNSIVGTWSYSEPAIVFTSENFLAKAGASLVSNKLESKLQEQLSKYGIKEGTLTLTFNEDGTFTETLGSKTMSGSWTITDQKLSITYLGVKSIQLTTQLESNKLMFVTDASKLLTLIKTMGSKSGNASLSTISTLMNSVKGMQAGITLVKKQ